MLAALPDLSIDAFRDRALAAGAAAACAVVLAVVGLVAERFCQLPPDDGGEGREGREGSVTREDPETPGAGTPA